MAKSRLLIAAILGGILLLVFPFVASTYVLHLGVFILIYVFLTIGVGMVLGYIGELSFGHAAFYGIGAYASALLTLKLNLSFWLAMPLAVLITAIFGFVIGALSLRTRGHYFALVTMGFGEIIHIVIHNWEKLTGGTVGLRGIQPPDPISLGFVTLRFDSKMSMYYLTLVFAVLAVLFFYRLTRSHFGRIFVAIREDNLLSEFNGLATYRYKLINFTISSAITGLGGVFAAHYILYISPDFVTLTQSVSIVLMVVVGGVATVAGPVIGAVILTLLLEWLNAAGEFKMMVYGLFLMLIIVFMPKGITGLLRLGRKYSAEAIKAKPSSETSVE